MSASGVHPTVVEYEAGRARRQAVGFGAALLLMAGLAAFGTWMVVAGHQQYPGRAEAWVGTAFGLLFVLLALASLISAVEVLQAIQRASTSERPLLLIDSAGVTGADGVTVPWQAVAGIRALSDLPSPHRSNRLAQADPGHRTSLGVKHLLDRYAGAGLGMRDGRRFIRVLLTDGSERAHDLSLPIGPTGFDAIVAAVSGHAHHHRIPFTGPARLDAPHPGPRSTER